jgi:hypothetical protein
MMASKLSAWDRSREGDQEVWMEEVEGKEGEKC